jgi:hypothetical protein
MPLDCDHAALQTTASQTEDTLRINNQYSWGVTIARSHALNLE